MSDLNWLDIASGVRCAKTSTIQIEPGSLHRVRAVQSFGGMAARCSHREFAGDTVHRTIDELERLVRREFDFAVKWTPIPEDFGGEIDAIDYALSASNERAP